MCLEGSTSSPRLSGNTSQPSKTKQARGGRVARTRHEALKKHLDQPNTHDSVTAEHPPAELRRTWKQTSQMKGLVNGRHTSPFRQHQIQHPWEGVQPAPGLMLRLYPHTQSRYKQAMNPHPPVLRWYGLFSLRHTRSGMRPSRCPPTFSAYAPACHRRKQNDRVHMHSHHAGLFFCACIPHHTPRVSFML